MKKLFQWFNNHSLGFKIVTLLCILVLLLQILNGIIFFSIISDRFEKSISESNQATVNQMAANINRTLEDIVTEMTDVRSRVISYQLTESEEKGMNQYATKSIVYQELFDQLLASKDNYQFVNSMFVLGSDGETYSYSLYSYMRVKEADIFTQILEDYSLDAQVVWSSVIEESYFFENGDSRLLSIIMPVYRYSKVKNLVVVNLNLEAVGDYLRELKGEEQDAIILMQTSQGESFGYDEAEEFLEASEELQEIYRKKLTGEKILTHEYSVLSSELQINHWQVSMITLLSNIRSTTNDMTRFVIVVIFSTLLIMLTGMSVIVYTITKPIKKMTGIMEANRHTKTLSHRFHAKYKDEVGTLARTYNSLMDEISQLMEEIHREQIQNRNSYFKLLQLQIKPHFLYNTLESVKFMVEMKDEKSVEMLGAIGKFYKLSLTGIYDKVKIREEVEHLSCYLKILQMRYSSRYSYEIAVPEEIQDEEIVKFTLQPIVENAVYHGIKEKRKKGKILIKGIVEGDYILLTIWDNGVGIPEEKLRELQRQLKAPKEIQLKEHIGILNVHQRLYVQYGEGYGIELQSRWGEYTEVRIKLPYCRRGKANGRSEDV